ncbi:DUF5957 family protein [Micromonospora cathayae]|uniref:DUF5957 family protein n=1 Tax=Micromonospora cathayae TaxID=3028804 RepID=A0ABY7ZJ78_9ACTN|nr:DUF5957 family protein [Micromonospora sp. HUAS 3]WDZ82148.1 DUF5957 family protein [Micromonospora sp. HUAS 3]
MRTLVAVLIGLVAGFFAGIVLDQVIGVIGLLTSDDGPTGFRFLPLVLAAVGAVVAVLVDRSRQRGGNPPRR